MIPVFFYTYLTTLLTAFLIGVTLSHHHKSFWILKTALGMSVLVESLAYYRTFKLGISPFPIYHFFVPIHYTLMTIFWTEHIERPNVKRLAFISGAFFVITSLALSFFYYDSLLAFPGLQTNLMGVLNCGFSSYVLFTLMPLPGVRFVKHPLTWLCIGVLSYSSGSFIINGIYNYLVETKSKDRILVHAIFNNVVNIFQYICLGLCFYLSWRLRERHAEIKPT